MSDRPGFRPEFRIEIHQNKYLSLGDIQVHAIAMVEAAGGPATVTGACTGAAEVIIVDTSASMAGERLAAAKRAAKAAVDALREGVDFAVVSGADVATMVYPRDLLMAPASDRGRAQAKRAISRLSAAGGTRIGRWLNLAGALFADHQSGVRHAILLTDGKDEHETAGELDAMLADCTGRFVCDCRGVGTDWDVTALRRVANALLGGVGLVAEPNDLAADFTAMIETAMDKTVADVMLRIWTPHHATPCFVKQVLPAVQDLTGRRTEIGPPGAARAAGPAVGDYPTGIWGTERRDYHVCVTVPAGEPYEEILAARVSLVLPSTGDAPDVVLAEGNVLAEWTDDEALTTGVDPWVGHYSEQERLTDSIRRGLGAYKRGDLGTAGQELGHAADLAQETGNSETSTRLANLVDVDPATGVTVVKEGVDKAAEMELDVTADGSVPPPATVPMRRIED